MYLGSFHSFFSFDSFVSFEMESSGCLDSFDSFNRGFLVKFYDFVDNVGQNSR